MIIQKNYLKRHVDLKAKVTVSNFDMFKNSTSLISKELMNLRKFQMN